MLAVRLHIKKNPKLNKGCYLVPIFDWAKDKTTLNYWVTVLNQSNQRRPNHKVNYITLVSIPDHFPIYISFDWSERKIIEAIAGGLPIKPLSEQREIAKEIANQNRWMPEIILGEKLPKKYIKWTKDYLKFRKMM